MNHYESEEWDFDDNVLYDKIRIEDLPVFLTDLGYNTRKIEFTYLSYDHYKHIFHFALVKHFGVSQIFSNYITPRNYVSFNNIMINAMTDVKNTSEFLTDIFKMTRDIICIFVDLHSSKQDNKYHTTLLIYRKKENTIEYFDSNGAGGYGFTFKLRDIIDIVISNFTDMKLIKSKELNGLEQYSNPEACARGLNNICGISRAKSVSGWCQIWSLFIYELIVKYPQNNTKYIIQVVYSLFKDRNYKESSVILNNMLKGFYRIIIGRTNMIFRSINSQLHIKAEILSEYNPAYVIQDREMDSLIYTQMSPYLILDSEDYNLLKEKEHPLV